MQKNSIHISANFRLQNRIIPPNVNVVLQVEDICIQDCPIVLAIKCHLIRSESYGIKERIVEK